MLHPFERRQLFELLRPPPGYALDCAVGTTFSLDLLALLTAPLAFTRFEWNEDSGPGAVDRMALLETIRRYAARIHLFCQAGRIALPKEGNQLLIYLEDSVFPVVTRKPRASFHPKVWALRFTAPDAPVHYRLLCLSRNLTFDRSWDTALALEGVLTDRKRAFPEQHPLGDFFAALPELARAPLPETVRANVDLIQYELRRVQFQLPQGFERLVFWPLGLKARAVWPFPDTVNRLLIVSPFAANECITRLTARGTGHILVSRPECLATLSPGARANLAHQYVLDPAAEPSGTEESAANPETPLIGLHAKLYVADIGRGAHIWTGSANATNAAFNSNVEFLIELVGRKVDCGVDAILNPSKDQTGLQALLQEFTPPDGPPVDAIQEQLEKQVDEARQALARADLQATVAAVTPDTFEIRVESLMPGPLPLPAGVAIRCWPIMVNEPAGTAVGPGPGVLAVLGPLSLEALTPFLAFACTARQGDRTLTVRFVLHLPLIGAPADRREAVLRALLRDREAVLRFLLFLLADSDLATPDLASDLFPADSLSQPGNTNAPASPRPLFEALVRALDRDHTRLDQIATIVADLRKTAEGQHLLPDEFDQIWEPIWAARQRIRR